MTPVSMVNEALPIPMNTSSPRQAQTEPLVYFDGVCGLCNRFVQFLLDEDPDGKLKFAPLQGDTARERLNLPEITRLDSVVFTADGKTWKRSAAVVRILNLLGGKWKWAGNALWLVPSPLRDLAYMGVANVRYQLFGRSETCRLPTSEEQARFLP